MVLERARHVDLNAANEDEHAGAKVGVDDVVDARSNNVVSNVRESSVDIRRFIYPGYMRADILTEPALLRIVRIEVVVSSLTLRQSRRKGTTSRGLVALTNAMVLADLARGRNGDVRPEDDDDVAAVGNVMRKSSETGLPDEGRAPNAAHWKNFPEIGSQLVSHVTRLVIDFVSAKGRSEDCVVRSDVVLKEQRRHARHESAARDCAREARRERACHGRAALR